ncbi:Laminin subunit gamma-1 [Lamellibrachia satsuma]|nr:Laminin subunit gamma-1 [Lamellibrachia satsuma]
MFLRHLIGLLQPSKNQAKGTFCAVTDSDKSFDITYVRLKFYSSRPDSFAIYKRASQDEPWSAYQYYSASCEDTYGKRNKEIITAANEAKAICTDEFSDISPLTGGSVAFSTLEGRPSAYNFEHSAELQEWVTATEIKIVLNRLNTFGDEVFGDPNVLKSYFYAISDFAVGARCKCNGHASECVRSTGQGLEERNVCRCEHNTQGPDCSECQPFYNDRPWKRATADGAHECIACDCNGLSNRCFFDEELYRKTGHGGHCLDCRENTFGIHCERCKDYFYRLAARNKCQSCNCHAIGALYRQCDENGKCQCKRGVTGDKCDRCDVNFYDFGQSGCRSVSG